MPDQTATVAIDAPGVNLANLFVFLVSFALYILQNFTLIALGIILAVIGVLYIFFHLLGFM